MSVAEKQQTQEVSTFPSLFSRYVRVFIAPDVLFQTLRTRPDWFGAMILGACLASAATLLIPPDLTYATIRETLLEQGQTPPPELADQLALFRYAGGAAALVFWCIAVALFAGLVMIGFAFLLGHDGTYRQYLAVVAHSHLVAATSTFLLLPLRIISEDAQLLLSVGTFAVFLDDGYFFRFLSYLDLFGLWSWVLVGLGVARIARKKSWAVGAVLVLSIPMGMSAVIAIFAP